MKDFSRCPVQQFLKAQKVTKLEFFIRKMPSSFSNIPTASNEHFAFLLLCRKFAGFHGQQFGMFSLNLVFQIFHFLQFFTA